MQTAAREIKPQNGHTSQQPLTDLMGDNQYAVSLLKVKTIMEYDTVTEVLQTWEWIRKMSAPTVTSKTTNGSDTRT